jgi:hypothetical protein
MLTILREVTPAGIAEKHLGACAWQGAALFEHAVRIHLFTLSVMSMSIERDNEVGCQVNSSIAQKMHEVLWN